MFPSFESRRIFHTEFNGFPSHCNCFICSSFYKLICIFNQTYGACRYDGVCRPVVINGTTTIVLYLSCQVVVTKICWYSLMDVLILDLNMIWSCISKWMGSSLVFPIIGTGVIPHCSKKMHACITHTMMRMFHPNGHITQWQSHYDVITTSRRRLDVIMTLILLIVPASMNGFDGTRAIVPILLVKLLQPKSDGTRYIDTYRVPSNISHTLVGNKIVDHSDVVGTSPVGASPITSSFSN